MTDAAESAAELARRRSLMPTVLNVATETGMETAVTVIADHVIPETPIDTGALGESTGTEVHPLEGQAVGLITQNAQNAEGKYYGQFLIHGYRIWFYGEDTGRYRAPDDYPLRAFEKAQPELITGLQSASRTAVQVLRIG